MIFIRTGYHIRLEIANGVAFYVVVLAEEPRSHVLRLRGVLACSMGEGEYGLISCVREPVRGINNAITRP